MEINDRVKVKGTSLIGKIVRVGQFGLLMINIESEHSAFDRTVYDEDELEMIS